MASEDNRPEWDSRFGPALGFGLSFLLHLFQVPMQRVFHIGIQWIGVSQLVYMVPAILIAKVSGRRGLVIGLIIGASLVFLFSAACFGLLFVLLRGYSGR